MSFSLCTFSKSEVYENRILPSCPLGLTRAEHSKCPCRKRLYHLPPNDLRVLSCQFPNTYRGDTIHSPEAFVASLRRTLKQKRDAEKADKPKPPKKTKEKPMSEQTTQTQQQPKTESPKEPPGASTALTLRTTPTYGGLSIYDSWKASEITAFVNGMGSAIHQSGMLGCKSLAQGQMLAMACLCEKRNPVEMKRVYHIIEGNLTMRADAMLAEFNARGGKHKTIERTADRVSIELRKPGGGAEVFSFTWQEAQDESYIYTGPANKGDIPKKINGEINRYALKENWSTPRRRMQMMWARVVSDAVRTVMPGVCSGYYTPEEFDASTNATTGEPEDPDVYEAEIVEDRKSPPTPPPPQQAENKPQSTAAEKKVEPAAETKPAETSGAVYVPPSDSPQLDPHTAPDGYPVDMSGIYLRLATARDELIRRGKITMENYKAAVERRGVKSAKELDRAECIKLLEGLESKLRDARGEAERKEWAEKQVGSKSGNAK